MLLEKQVTSLELSKQLQDAGVAQKSAFYWVNWNIETHKLEGAPQGWQLGQHSHRDCENVSAFTCSELGEILPQKVEGDEMNFDLNIWKEGEEWAVSYWWDEDTRRLSGMKFNIYQDRNLVEAMGQMLLYLLQNNLINPSTLNKGEDK